MARPALDLGGVWLFSECSRGELKAIEKRADPLSVKAGTVLCDEGEVGQSFYFVVSGRATVTTKGRKTAEIEAGGYFGELALLDRLPRSATVRAATDMELVAIDQRGFDKILKESPSLARKLLVATASRLRSADQKALKASIH